MTGLGPLENGGRVAVVGGGPGGVGCALALQRKANQLGRRIEITIFEGKQFAGAHQHNLCVGVVSPPLPSLLEDTLRVPCPEHLRTGVITAYVLHTRGESIVLEDPTHESYSLRRVQFDDYMLQAARHRGIRVISARVNEIEFHDDRAVVYSEAAPAEVDVVVGAFGLDVGAAGIFSEAVGYVRPKALVSLLTRYYPKHEELEHFGPRIHAFLLDWGGIEFAAVSPKGDHLTINIAGRSVTSDTMRRFLASPHLKRVLPEYPSDQLRGPAGALIFKGRFPRGLAHHYYGDRFVMVGDAAGLVRAFKGKGVTSAVQTGIRAAETILQQGISRQAFASSYVPANQDIIGDLAYGRTVRWMVLLTAQTGLLASVVRAARRDPAVSAALYGAVSGHEQYRDVLAHMFRPHSIASVLRAMLV